MPAFRVKFECKNCGHSWWEVFEKGDRVEERIDGVYLHSHKCTHTIDCPHCGYIECPVCGLKEDVKVVRRIPLKGSRSWYQDELLRCIVEEGVRSVYNRAFEFKLP